MFTGLVEALGRVAEVVPAPGATRLAIGAQAQDEPWERGESIAVDGVCLTVVDCHAHGFAVDVVAETLARTTLGGLTAGDAVNLERALRVGDRLGGHWVQGHVDGTLPVLEVCREGHDHRVRLALEPELARFVAFKGSITLQGVSLTVSAVAPGSFEVALIPETLARTTLGRLVPGQRLNVEVDLLARYLDAQVGSHE